MNGEIRPKLKIPLSVSEKILVGSSLVINIFAWIYLFMQWSEIPSIIPSHFDLYGNPDSWGGKSSILIATIMFSLSCVVIMLLSRIPQYFNYIVTITKENADRQYRNARKMILLICFYISILAFYIPWSSVQVANGNTDGLNSYVVVLVLIGIFGTVGYFIYKMKKLK